MLARLAVAAVILSVSAPLAADDRPHLLAIPQKQSDQVEQSNQAERDDLDRKLQELIDWQVQDVARKVIDHPESEHAYQNLIVEYERTLDSGDAAAKKRLVDTLSKQRQCVDRFLRIEHEMRGEAGGAGEDQTSDRESVWRAECSGNEATVFRRARSVLSRRLRRLLETMQSETEGNPAWFAGFQDWLVNHVPYRLRHELSKRWPFLEALVFYSPITDVQPPMKLGKMEPVAPVQPLPHKAPKWDPFGKLKLMNGETIPLHDNPNDWVVPAARLRVMRAAKPSGPKKESAGRE